MCHLFHDVFNFVLLTVQNDPSLFLCLQILEQRAVGLVLLLVFEVPHVDCRHLPLPLCCCVQNYLQRRQACGPRAELKHSYHLTKSVQSEPLFFGDVLPMKPKTGFYIFCFRTVPTVFFSNFLETSLLQWSARGLYSIFCVSFVRAQSHTHFANMKKSHDNESTNTDGRRRKDIP